MRERRKKQKEDWLRWCSKFCNLVWAKRIAFEVVSERSSYKKRLTACWSASAPFLSDISCSELKLSHNIVARIASLAMHPDSADLLDQVVCCASDERRRIIPSLWLKIKEDFVCGASWVPLYQFTFSEDVKQINPSVSPHDDVSLSLIAETWSLILLHLGRMFSSPLRKLEQQVVWNHFVCDPASEIPVSERAITMWIWLLWSSHSLPFSLNQTLLRPPVVDSSFEVRNAEERLSVLASLLSKRMITKAEFTNKRQCIIHSL